ncbi:MAG TPA: DUF3341 domain-containing protein, partial [Caulobacteraceae bacterium]|nr:DUF3341 domain-containing protein [Caulobacteraceae bacterium]
LLEAVRSLYKAGYRRFEAYSPFPIDGLAEAEGFKGSPIALITLIGGAVGAVTGYGMQVYTNLNFPIDLGGRPLIAPPAFVLITFELMVLFAVTACILAMLICNRLPKLSHPVFDLARFDLTSLDRFFIVVDVADDHYDARRTREKLKRLGAVDLQPLEQWKTPS